jgi:hypothetical protein
VTPGQLPGTALVLAVALAAAGTTSSAVTADEAYLAWSAAQAETVGKRAYQRGRVGGWFDTRLLKTERSYNYKVAATWLTPEVIRASARLHQLRSRLDPDQTRALVAEAEAAGGTVIMIEIDPREGSGVIPLDWQAFLQPRGNASAAVVGVNTPHLRSVKALTGVLRRNYDYDRFWVVFPDAPDAPYLRPGVGVVELVVRIHNQEGRVEWQTPLR